MDSPGDNLLAESPSALEAVQCAVAIQWEINARNMELPVQRRMQFRLGINLGDVIAEGEQIYGDGINIAARLESLAEAGGICNSRMVDDQIATKLAVGYEFLGQRTVKNITHPVRVYRVRTEPGLRGLPEGLAEHIGYHAWVEDSLGAGGAASPGGRHSHMAALPPSVIASDDAPCPENRRAGAA